MNNKIILLGLLLGSSLYASEYEEWLKKQSSGFYEYKKSMDEEFSAMLKKDWESFQTMFAPSSFEKPKPKAAPKVEKVVAPPKKIIEQAKKVKKIKIVKEEVKQPIIVAPKIEKNEEQKGIKINFFNQELIFAFDDRIKNIDIAVSKKGISKYWDSIVKTDYNLFIDQLNRYKNKFGLNDWAMYQLVYKFANTVFKNNNKTNLFAWFIFTKMGYDTKVAYNDSKIFLLSNISQKLYQVAYFTLDKKRYYIMDPQGKVKSVGSIYTYKGDYPDAKEKLTFDMSKSPIKIYTNTQTKNISFSYGGEKYSFKSKFSKDLVDFYKTFPQSEYMIYFDSKKSPFMNNTLLEELKPHIENKNEIEAVNFLLRLVQKGFEYKRDDEQFDYEKVMFPEETVFYPYSDCEDRSIMFSYLVENLLGLDVVGIKFSDHLATAVKFSSKTSGDRFQFNGGIYTITDPTYINANAGMTMPQYKNKQFSIIP